MRHISQAITVTDNISVFFNLRSLYFSNRHVGTCCYDKSKTICYNTGFTLYLNCMDFVSNSK